jgi:2-polyprenyl-3-methyl-5-hydroxy-6-metoxy-1,4-benzoquinol methylase
MRPHELEQRILASWHTNAAAWTSAVRHRLIPSRRAGTDAAIMQACARLRPKRVLDIGCGEGWLTRALAEIAGEAVGIDGSAALIDEARAAGGALFEVLDYQTIEADSKALPGPWDAIVCNFALLGDPLTPFLAALRTRLGPRGRLLIQTVHPWACDAPYENGWREENFASFETQFPATMPWYFRTLESWFAELRLAGLLIENVEEPVDAATGKPLSLLFQCVAVGYQRH